MPFFSLFLKSTHEKSSSDKEQEQPELRSLEMSLGPCAFRLILIGKGVSLKIQYVQTQRAPFEDKACTKYG